MEWGFVQHVCMNFVQSKTISHADSVDMQILLASNDEYLSGKVVVELTERRDRTVDVEIDLEAARQQARDRPYDLAIVDARPSLSAALALFEEMREDRPEMLRVLLLAEDAPQTIAETDRADVFLFSPFSPEKISERTRSLLNDRQRGPSGVLRWQGLCLEPKTGRATYNDRPIPVTPKEYALLELLARHRDRIFSPRALISQLWSFEKPPEENTIRAHVKGLRRKLRKAGAPQDTIETVYGAGYRLNPSLEENDGMFGSRSSVPQNDTHVALLQAWRKFQPQICDRLGVVLEAAEAARTQALTMELQKRAEEQAATLVRILGAYGFVEAARLAEELQAFCASDAPLDREKIPEFNQRAIDLSIALEGRPVWEPLQSLPQMPLLLVADEREDAVRALVRTAPNWQVRTCIATDLSAAREAVRQHAPDLALLHMSFTDNEPDSKTKRSDALAFASELSALGIPVMAIAEGGGFPERVEIARRGGNAFLPASTPPQEILHWVCRLWRRSRPNQTAMVVGAEGELVRSLQQILQPRGFHVVSLRDSRQFWEFLEAEQPDLLLLRWQMPHLSGADICQVVRNDLRWGQLPIFMLAQSGELENVSAAYAAGADVVLHEPLVEEELIFSLLNGLERQSSYQANKMPSLQLTSA